MTLSWKLVALLVAMLTAVTILALAHVLERTWVENTLFFMLGGLVPVWVRRSPTKSAETEP
jgi:hypothetical protein